MEKIIFVCCPSRSGSTMVDLMIGNDDNSFSMGEVYAWFRPFRTHHFEIICSCKSQRCPWEKLKNFKEKKFYSNCFAITNANVLVDSSKELTWIIDNNIRAIKEGISTHNILLFKEPISFFYSSWKRGRSIDAARNEYIQYYKMFFQCNLPYISLNYNTLISHPSKTLEKLCTTLNIPFFEGKERFWEKEHHHLYGSGGTRMQVEKGNSEIINTEHYPKEFNEIIPQIELDNQKNNELVAILNKLRASELQETKTIDSINKKFWYYKRKLKKIKSRYFPEKWDKKQ